jgi:hypothetical protein
MITVPAILKTEIEKLRGRHLEARVKIDYSDANIDNTVVAWSNGTQLNTYEDQVYNGREDMSAQWASLDGSWILGTHALGPETAIDKSKYEIGWWNNTLSMLDGSFQEVSVYGYNERGYGEEGYGPYVSYPQISTNFLARTVSSIRISFDNARMEYAVDFDIILTAQDGSVLDSISVVGNSGVKYITSIIPVNLVCQITLIISKWSHARRQAKVAEMFTAISETYNGSDIFNIQVVENRELPEDGIPLGQTASGQCVITFFNRNRDFDYTNTLSKLYGVIREGNRITPEIGDGINWVPLGVYYAKAWDISVNKLTVTVTGLDRMASLAESEFNTNQIIAAPADQNYLTDTAAEWNGGTKIDMMVLVNSIRMIL